MAFHIIRFCEDQKRYVVLTSQTYKVLSDAKEDIERYRRERPGVHYALRPVERTAAIVPGPFG